MHALTRSLADGECQLVSSQRGCRSLSARFVCSCQFVIRLVGATTGLSRSLASSRLVGAGLSRFPLTPASHSLGLSARWGMAAIHVGPAFERGAKENGWEPANAPDFKLRSKNYLKDKVKVPSEPSAFRLVGVHGFTAADKIPFVTEDQRLATCQQGGAFTFVFHFDVSPQHLVLVFELDPAAIEGANANSGFANAWARFLAGDDAYKAPRIKLITSMVEATWVVRKTVGKPVPALIGNKLTCSFRQRPCLLECTCDVTSSFPARVILGVVRGACTGIVCDLMLLIEGCQPDELPERMIGGARVFRMNLARFPPIDDRAMQCAAEMAVPTEEEVQSIIHANAEEDSNRRSPSAQE